MKKFWMILLAGLTTYAYAQEDNAVEKKGFFNENMEYSARAHFSIGGSAPLGLPKEIRQIKGYNPTLALGLQANATKMISADSKWGVRVGVEIDAKGMKTKARVKNYLTRIEKDGQEVRGYFTGLVKTDVRNTYFTVPVSAVYKLNPRWNLYGGLYVAGLIDKNFSGYVTDGHFRQDSPIGPKITFDEDSRASYNFSDEVRTFQWGAQIGAEWFWKKHLFLFPELTYGFNGILDPNFDAISFNLHNVYLNLGFGYKF